MANVSNGPRRPGPRGTYREEAEGEEGEEEKEQPTPITVDAISGFSTFMSGKESSDRDRDTKEYHSQRNSSLLCCLRSVALTIDNVGFGSNKTKWNLEWI